MVDRSLVAMGACYVVRYMRFRARYPAQEFIDAQPAAARVRVVALARRLADVGRLPDSTHGHFLKAPYDQIFELKPPGVRVFGFFHERNLYLTHGAPKKKVKEQAGDYATAERLRADFFARLAGGSR